MITDSFDNTQPIIGLEAFYGEQKHLITTCLVLFSEQIHAFMLDTYVCEPIAAIHMANGSITIYKTCIDGKEIGFYLTGIGATLTGGCCLEANWLTGATKFIMFGSAGSLDREKTTGKFVIPTESYRDEGMSYHYAPPADYIEIRNHSKLAGIFEELGIPYVEGRVWTTDAMLRETVGQVEKRKKEGCIAVEMELAGMQAVCDFQGFELYDFLATGDVLSMEGYDASGLSDANHNVDKLQIALEIARRI